MKKLFGTDGMRCKAGDFPLDQQTIRKVGASLALHLREQSNHAPTILIGRDTRESGDWLEAALVQGARSQGANCLSAGVITTPGVAYLGRVLPADAGIVISASHNPYYDNGVKIFAPSGQKIDAQTERLIEADIYSDDAASKIDDPDLPVINEQVTAATPTELQERYVTFLANEVGHDLSLTGLKIVIDCANGAASRLAPELFERLGASVIAISNTPDGRNINQDCGSLHIENLVRAVRSEQADLGIAFDGDADRSLFVDHQGNFVNGDATLWVLANYFMARGQLAMSTVVATVMSNIGLELALNSRAIEMVRTDVGDKYVLEHLLKSGASLGGEQSGHVIIPRISLAGDGMITSLSLLRAIVEAGKSLGELTEGLVHYPQVLVNVPVKEKVPFADVPAIQTLAEVIKGKLGQQGRLLLRYSGTESLARIMIEGQNQSEIESYAEEIASEIRRSLA